MGDLSFPSRPFLSLPANHTIAGTKKESFQGHAAWRRRADALAFTARHFQICQIGARGSRNDVVRSVMAPGAEISAGLASAASPLPPMGSRLHCGRDFFPSTPGPGAEKVCFAQASQLPVLPRLQPSRVLRGCDLTHQHTLSGSRKQAAEVVPLIILRIPPFPGHVPSPARICILLCTDLTSVFCI